VASFEQKRIAELQTAARVLGKQLLVLKATTGTELDDAFATVVQEKAGAVLVGTFAFLSQKGEQLAALAARFAIPMISFNREFTASGGLISYGTSRSESWRQIGVYAGRILKGEKPGDLPVVVPTKFELTINIRTAKALGLAVPPTLRALADEVIE
jgi:putative ABC transport system substrate-binding protein